MKRIRIVPSNKPVTTVVVAGKPHHYFHSEVLGKCRAIIIAPDDNLPNREKSHVDLVNEEIELFEQQAEKSKGDCLDVLMNSDSRLFLRFARYWENYKAARDNESKAFWLKRATLVQRAMTRISIKIGLLFPED